jgi:hypothetical protein
LSLFEEHTKIITRRKIGKLREFGRKILLNEVEGGIVGHYEILEDVGRREHPHFLEASRPETATAGEIGSSVSVGISHRKLGLEPWGIELDLRAFEDSVSLARRETSLGGRSAAAGGRQQLTGRLLGDLELYRGEFVKGFWVEDAPEFVLWVEAERTR